nr:membrane protein [Georgenia sp. SUBG003]
MATSDSAGSVPAGRPAERGAIDLDRRAVCSGLLFGTGIAASMIDLFIFHLALHWHHFYDRSTTAVALTADGFFHAFGWFVTIWSLFLLADLRRRAEIAWGRWVAAVVTGVGLMQLFDGVVFHKVLRVHQIRYDVELLPYDVAWIGSAALLVLLGLLLLRRTRPSSTS